MGSNDDGKIEIPVIDISAANPEAPEQLLSAARDFGFVFVANNSAGISPVLISQLFSISKDFFALPPQTKLAVSISSNKAGKNHGWLGQGVEKLDPATQKRPDVKEAFNMGMPAQDGTYEQPLPPVVEENIEAVKEFQIACAELCQRILTHFATALKIPSDWFTSRHSSPRSASQGSAESSVFRLLFYPQQTSTNDDVDIRAGAHSDYGSITALFQLPGQPGLEILTPQGTWSPVPVDPLNTNSPDSLPILVNIGDLLEDWTNGLLKSTKHRVVFPKEEHGDRYSIAYFCHPLDDALLEPVPSKMVEEHSKTDKRKTAERNGRTITARDHLMERLAATYTV